MPKPEGSPTTILVVDDDELVLALVVRVLKDAQFHVVAAATAAQALQLAEDLTTHIDLLLSDVDLPGMNGPDLGETMKKARPDLHVMLMSGLSGGALLVLNNGWAFIDKPFVPKELVTMVRTVLARPDESQGGKHFSTQKNIDHK